MKRSELFFDAVLLPLDFFALLAAGAAAYYLRISPLVQEIRPAVFVVDLPFGEYMQLVSIVAAVILIIFGLQGLYAMQVTRRALEELTRMFAGISIGVMLVIVFMFLSAELFQSRFILLAAYFFGVVFVTTSRYVVRSIQRALLRRGFGAHRVVLAGNGQLSHVLEEICTSQPERGYRVVATLPIIRWDLLENVYRDRGIDEVIQTDPTMPEEDNLTLLDFCENYKVDYKYIPNLFETHAANVRFRQIGRIPVMELLRTPLDGWGRIAKRVLDLVGAVFGLIILSPLFAAIAVAIKLDSPGPVFYRQVRIGRNTRPFEIVKFRSMKREFSVGQRYGGKQAEEFEQQLRRMSNERVGPLFKMRDDPRVTRVGRFLRRWRIDELPQLFNVFKGDMSLVGPRPHLPREVEHYNKFHRKLFTIKPGMSGVAQVSGSAGLPFEEEAKLDVTYIENWSLRLDIVLLLKTFKVLLSDKHAV